MRGQRPGAQGCIWIIGNRRWHDVGRGLRLCNVYPGEMQWIKTKSPSTQPNTSKGPWNPWEEDTSLDSLFMARMRQDLMDRDGFSKKVTRHQCLIPRRLNCRSPNAEYRKIVSDGDVRHDRASQLPPFREERNHPLTTRRYYTVRWSIGFRNKSAFDSDLIQEIKALILIGLAAKYGK